MKQNNKSAKNLNELKHAASQPNWPAIRMFYSAISELAFIGMTTINKIILLTWRFPKSQKRVGII